ncbi:frataxin domain-containing protein [Candidatus Sneabacter namystus]|uniref:Iron donor protein CyaY n=1 Tax=Candidatus Sneabacter namystus TaxID=2601646 RepID=A0A5C0UHW3_9RICK|nr:frataxin domain-containing protein [Candidatus Sneabacter namystus]QEK39678.1 hypothetical protein FZC37_01895 [Candidatus Sneabacter namystus]
MNYSNDVDIISIGKKTLDYIEDVLIKEDVQCQLDIDRLGDLALKISSTVGTHLINVHSDAKELWLSSTISGAYHFSYIKNTWKDKNSSTIFSLLKKELEPVVTLHFTPL